MVDWGKIVGFAAGVHDLAYCFQRGADVLGAIYVGNPLDAAANAGAAVGKFVWYGRDKLPYLKEALKNYTNLALDDNNKMLPTPTFIIDITMVLIVQVDLFNGFWFPGEVAEDFVLGISAFDNHRQALQRSEPDPDEWDGDSAAAYAAANEELILLSEKMKELDAKMQDLVEKQADAVQLAHDVIALTAMGLVFAQGVALLLYLKPPPVGPQLSYWFQIVVAGAALDTVIIYEMITAEESKTNAQEANILAPDYDGVTQALQPSGTSAVIEVPRAVESTVSRFKAVTDRMSGVSAMPDLASMASLAGEGASAEVRALFSTFIGGGETPGGTPAFTLPTLSQLIQAAQVSGHLSEHMNLVNQTTGQRPQRASMAAQGQGAPAPAEEAALEGEVDGAGAGVASATERAPIEVATVGAQQGQEPSPLERIVSSG